MSADRKDTDLLAKCSLLLKAVSKLNYAGSAFLASCKGFNCWPKLQRQTSSRLLNLVKFSSSGYTGVLRLVQALEHQPGSVPWAHILKNAIELGISLLQASVCNIYSLRALRPPVMLKCFPKRNQRTEESRHAQRGIIITADSKENTLN